MTEIDPRPRQLLRDYARENVTAPVVGMRLVDHGERVEFGMRGELAGPVFEALQGVLELAERRHMVTAEEIFAAVRKPFER
jgi:hypothetical protein